jgi:multidrug resistance efflux pump
LRPLQGRRTEACSNCRRNRSAGQSTVRLLLVLVAISALSGCRADETRADSQQPPPIEIKAVVQPAKSIAIAAQIDGQVRTVSVREGAVVEASAPLVELSNPLVERDAAAAHAQVEWLDERLKRGASAPRPSPSTPRGTLEITARILKVKQQRYEKMKQLRATNDITARELEQAEVEYLAALREYDQMRATPAAVGAAEDKQLLRIERDKAAAEDRFAAERRNQLQITSPFAGTVTRVSVVPGQAVFPRDPIVEVADVSTIQVRGNVAPELLRFLRPGMHVDVKVFSVPPRTFADEIDYVIPTQSGESRSATVVVTIPNPDHSVQPNTEALISLRSPR